MTLNEIILLLLGGGAFVFMMYMFIRAIFLSTPVDPEYQKKPTLETKPLPKDKAKA